MSAISSIEWTDATWNPVVGCSIVSAGCTNCYAMKMAARIERMNPASHYFGVTKIVNENAVWTGKIEQAPEHILAAPLKWKKPKRIFVNSMGDLFHESIPDEWIDHVFAVMALCPQHTFQVLTKRPERMRGYCSAHDRVHQINGAIWSVLGTPQGGKIEHGGNWRAPWPLPNIWLGTSCEDQSTADERIPHLLQTPAAVRFVSLEPLLGGIDLENLDYYPFLQSLRPQFKRTENDPIIRYDALRGHVKGPDDIGQPKLDWVIVGGESGPKARPMHPEWARSLRDQCKVADVPFFFKQHGEWGALENEASDWGRNWFIVDREGGVDVPDGRMPVYEEGEFAARKVGKKSAGRLLDGVNHSEFPEMRA